MRDLLLRGGRPWGRDEAADILVREGTIARIEPAIDALDAEVVDVAGRLVLGIDRAVDRRGRGTP